MNISEIAIRRPVTTWMLMISLMIFGWLGFSKMGVSQLPDVDFPVVSISTGLEGAAPEVIESDILDPIEDAIVSIQGIKSITSSARAGSASISVEFDIGKNIDLAVQEVQTALAAVQRRLPKDTDAPSVRKSNPEDQPIVWLSVSTTKLPQPELMALVRDRVVDQFLTLEGVSDVFLGGYLDPNLRIWVSRDKLRAYDLSVDDLISTITLEHSELPSGRIENAERESNVRILGEAKSASEFENLVISRRGGGPNFSPIRLGQVARIEEGVADVRRKSRVSGEPSIGLGIRKQRGSNAVAVAKLVKERMTAVQASLPEGVTLRVRFDGSTFIEEAVHELNFTIVLSAFLTALVCWIFLGSWSATLNVILAIPTALLGSFILLKALGFTLNTFTLLALTLSIGLVVDDAIMVLENISRRREMGESRMQAALNGSKEILLAVLATTAAIIAIFLPIAYLDGIIGKFMFQFGVTISIAIALSMVEALTLTPMRCAQFLTVKENRSKFGKWVDGIFEKTQHTYERTLRAALSHRMVVLVLSLVFFGASLFLAQPLKKEFLPSQDQSNLLVRMKAPEGTALEAMDKRVLEVEKIMSADPDLGGYFVSIGGFGGGDVNTAFSFVNLKPIPQRNENPKTGNPYTHLEIADRLRKATAAVKGIKIFVQDPSLSGFSSGRSFPVELLLKGPDWNTLVDKSQELKDVLEKSGMVVDVDSDFVGGANEIQIIPDRLKAVQRGVSVADVGRTLNALVGGVVAGRYSKGSRRYDIRVKLEADQRSKAMDLKSLFVRNNRGEMVALSEVIRIEEHPGAQVITRKNRERAISIFGNLAPGVSQTDAIDKSLALAKQTLPEGYRAVQSGSSQAFKETLQSLAFALALGILIAYMVLGAQFESFVHPITVLLALPFAISGALAALWLGGQTINLYSVIGIFLLMGIVKKNSILLVDFTNQRLGADSIEKRSPSTVVDALLHACPQRLRPVLMTSFAIIAGALPPALSIGPGAESQTPMAIAVIGGVLVSTLLTLYVVPCFYSLVEGGLIKLRARRKPEVHATKAEI
jgi:hydrophobe/amphiphile efflux-1 (HAE1) family protein